MTRRPPVLRQLAASLAGWLLLASAADAQGTDAYRNDQLFPIVVDSASFTQRFTFRSPGTVTLQPRFYRAEQQGPQNETPCPDLVVAGTRSVTSLRELCPALAAGTQYGMLRVAQLGNTGPGFAGFSRVSNPQGQGFSVEAFGREQFSTFAGENSGTVTGIRRLAATANSPAFQTNCFYGLAPAFSNLISSQESVTLALSVARADNGLGGSVQRTVFPGTLYRLLDVFAALGMPAGDVVDAKFTAGVAAFGLESPWAVIAFCTVQDNTSFGADFRIGKHQIDEAPTQRLTSDKVEAPLPAGFAPRPFRIQGSINWVNTHVVYFRHPDQIGCALVNVDNGSPLSPAFGLEMRLVEGDGTTVVAGGNNVVSFSGLYLGDRAGRKQGTVGRYTIQVEGQGIDSSNDRYYGIRCTSGSGHTRADIIRTQSGNRF